MKIKRFGVITLTVLIMISFISVVYTAERYIMPIAAEICLSDAKDSANMIINKAVENVITGKISVDDILEYSKKNEIVMINAKISTVNRLCGDISEEITNMLNENNNDVISVPAGAALRIKALSNTGPKIGFRLMPSGDAEVDYETEFVSAGINHINYKIWLTVQMTVSLVNPIYDEQMCMTRKIMLVDMIIEGEIPNSYTKRN